MIETHMRRHREEQEMDVRIVALDALAAIAERRDKYDQINRAIKELQGDFPSTVTMMDSVVEGAVIDALDAVLGEELASYYLYEASTMKGGGKLIEACGREWPICTMEDVRAYVLRVEK